MTDDIHQIVESFIGELREAGRGLVGPLQGPARTPETALQIAMRVQRIFELTRENLAATFPPAEPIACKAGCTYCCHLLFFTDALTVFLIADWLKNNNPPEVVEGLKARMTDFIDGGYGLKEVPRPPCPLLVDGLCMAYDVRPLVCRAQNSLQVSQCEEKHHGKRDMVVAHDIPLRVWVALSEGLSVGLAEAGLAGSESLEFVTALRIALGNPSAMDEWLAGKPVFEPAQWAETPRQSATGRLH